MDILTTLNETALTVGIAGRLDTSTAPQLEESLDGKLEGITSLVLDFSGLEYISSAGLRVILGLHKAMAGKGAMKVVNVNSTIMDIFEITGFDSILDIE